MLFEWAYYGFRWFVFAYNYNRMALTLHTTHGNIKI